MSFALGRASGGGGRGGPEGDPSPGGIEARSRKRLAAGGGSRHSVYRPERRSSDGSGAGSARGRSPPRPGSLRGFGAVRFRPRPRDRRPPPPPHLAPTWSLDGRDPPSRPARPSLHLPSPETKTPKPGIRPRPGIHLQRIFALGYRYRHTLTDLRESRSHGAHAFHRRPAYLGLGAARAGSPPAGQTKLRAGGKHPAGNFTSVSPARNRLAAAQ